MVTIGDIVRYVLPYDRNAGQSRAGIVTLVQDTGGTVVNLELFPDRWSDGPTYQGAPVYVVGIAHASPTTCTTGLSTWHWSSEG